jgi:L-iditol 2-dehydrogenase
MMNEAYPQSLILLAVDASAQKFKQVEQACPALPVDGALLSTTGCGLCGTDVEKLLYKKVPDGSVLGHEVVGKIAALGEQALCDFKVGQRVIVAHHVPCDTCHYCLNASPSMCLAFKQSNFSPGGFTPTLALSQGHLQHTTFAIPDHISDREAACTEPLACVLRAIDRLKPMQGQASVAVIGLGFIGLMASQVFKQQGAWVLGLDTEASRLHLAEVAGYSSAVWQATQEASSPALQTLLEANTAVGKVDTVCLTVGNKAAWELALSLVRDGGQILVLAASPEVNVSASTLYYRELNVITSYSPSLASLKAATEWIFNRRISLTPLITHPISWRQANEGLEAYRKREAIKVFFQFEGF